MTYDSWVSGISRPVVLYYIYQPLTAVYFVSYAFISAILMANVLIALLVDKYTKATTSVKNEDEQEEQGDLNSPARVVGPEMQKAMDEKKQSIIEDIVKIRQLCESLQHPLEDDPAEDRGAQGL